MTFSFKVAGWNKKVLNLLDRTLQKFAVEGYKAVVTLSPIKTGRYRASHRIGIGEPDRSVEPIRHSYSPLVIGTAPTADELAYATSKASKVRFGMTVHLTNSLVYAKPLEEGSSAQNGYRPDGIYGDALRMLSLRVPEVIQAVRAGKTEVSLERS